MLSKDTTLQGVRWVSIGNLGVVLVQMLQVSILARYLKPSDFGLLALAQIVVGFSQSFTDMGLSNAIIHKSEISNNQLNSLYWLNVFSGLIISLAVMVFASLIASFYDEPNLINVLFWVSGTFFAQSFGQQFFVLLQKNFQFKSISLIEIFSKVIGCGVSFFLAHIGYGITALLAANLATCIFSSVAFIYCGTAYHRPRAYFQGDEIREFLSFGLFQMGEKIINYFNYQIDALIIGYTLGSSDLGLYNMAKQIVIRPAAIINPIIGRVSFPVMARLQADMVALGIVYAKTMNYLASVNFFAYAIIWLFSDEIVHLYLGDGWVEIIPILRALAIWGALRSTGNPVGSLLMARGEAKRAFLWNAALLVLVPVAILCSSYRGIMGIANTLIGLQLLLFIPAWMLLIRPLCEVSFFLYAKQVFVPSLIVLMASSTSYLLGQRFETGIRRTLLMGATFVVIWLLLNIIFNRKFILDLIKLIQLRKLSRPNEGAVRN